MALYARQESEDLVFDTVFIGGGTPTVLSERELAQLLEGLHRHFPLPAGLEFTVEANPGTLSPAKLETLRRGGVNRLSIGAQAYQDHHLERLGRLHRFRHVVESVREARKAGFDNINLDLMFALPHQTLAEWEETLEAALSLEPEHLSCYSLIIEEGTPFGRLWAQGLLPVVDEELEAAMFQLAMERLQAAGYRHYEVSNFARPGRECRHNLIYWTNGQWLGLGPGAHSQWKGRRFANWRLPARYAKSLLEEGSLPVETSEFLTLHVQMEDELILGLRLREGISLSRFAARFGRTVWEVFGRALERAMGLGLLETDGDRLRLTDRGLMVANAVFVELVGEASP